MDRTLETLVPPPSYDAALSQNDPTDSSPAYPPNPAQAPGRSSPESYADSSDDNGLPPSPAQHPAQTTADENAPPGYLTIDTQPASFVLSSLFIYTFYPSPPHIGDATYQLSADLSTSSRELRIRRLNALDSRRVAAFAAAAHSAEAVRFERESALYVISRVFGKSRALEMKSRKKGGLPGTLHMEWDFRNWRVWQTIEHTELDVKVGEDERRLLFEVRVKWRERKKARYWEWRNHKHDVVAVETREKVGGDGEEKWMIELNERKLEGVMKDAVVACWVARAWYFSSAPSSTREVMSRWILEMMRQRSEKAFGYGRKS